MKRSVSAICLLASAYGMTALAQTASMPSAPAGAAPAAPAGPTKVGIIFFEPALAATNEGQRDLNQLRTKYEPRQAQLKTLSDEVEALKKSLQTSGSSLSDAERAAKTKSIDEKDKQLQRGVQELQSDEQSDENDFVQTLEPKLFNTVQQYAQQNGYTVVLDATPNQQQQQQTVLWASEGTNITQAVVQAYNTASGVPAQPAPAQSTAPRSTTPRSTTPRSGAPAKTPPSQ
jgi:outer membrane protein